MGFDDRHTEPLVLIVVVGVCVGAGVPLLRQLGLDGIALVAAAVGLVVAAITLLVALLNVVNLREWLRRKWRR